jgi:hypothetical protein
MNVTVVVPAVVGAICGAVGWLLVGLFMTGRQNRRMAKNAGRAVYFELAMNRLSVDVAVEYGSFAPLGRSTFDRLLPELATWLEPEELLTVAAAYMSHVGYGQVGADPDLPPDLRQQALSGILATQDRALGLLRGRVFSVDEARRMERTQAGVASVATTAAQDGPGSGGA